MHYDYVIIGAGIAGATAALEIRNRDANGTIAVFGDEPHNLYSRVLLPHLVRGKIEEQQVFLPQGKALENANITVIHNKQVTAINTDNKSVLCSDGTQTGYFKLLIATGGRIRPVDAKGADTAPIHYFQTLDDAIALKNTAGTTATVIGGSFIALEQIMSFVTKGIETTAVLRNAGFFSQSLDTKSQNKLNDVIEKQGVRLMTKQTTKEIIHEDNQSTIVLNNTTLKTDVLAAGIGLLPNIELAKNANIKTNQGILVNEYLETSIPDIYSAGDVAECIDPSTGDRRLIGNWQNAIFQGKIAGANMVSDTTKQKYDAVTIYSITVFGTPVIFIGNVTAKGSDITRTVEISETSIIQYIFKNHILVGATSVGPCANRADIISRITSKCA